MSPTLIPRGLLTPHQLVLWSEDFDPYVASDAGRLDTLFFGLHPPPDIIERVCQVGRNVQLKHGLTCPLVQNPHVTLLGINDYRMTTKAAIAGLRAAAANIITPPFRIGLRRLLSFENSRQRPFVLAGDGDTVPGLIMFQQQLVLALRHTGFRFRISTFTPHITLFYAPADLGEHFIDEIDWTAADFVLIHSLYGHGKHEVLGRWPFRAS
jgi:RNA 2',3'-cyclic 3'-phosphodiesterase